MVEIPIFFSVILLASPLASGLVAWELGLSFWRWLLIGTLLPGIALFALYVVARREELRKAQANHQARAPAADGNRGSA